MILFLFISLISGSYLLVSDNNSRGIGLIGLELGILAVGGLNLIGLVPSSVSIISTPIAVGALICWIGYVVSLLVMDWEVVVSSFVPEAPMLLVPLLFIIEIVSYLVRPVAIVLRIMVNLICSHLLLVVSGILVIGGMWVIIPLVLLLELSVAVVQSYVMFLLLSI